MVVVPKGSLAPLLSVGADIEHAVVAAGNDRFARSRQGTKAPARRLVQFARLKLLLALAVKEYAVVAGHNRLFIEEHGGTQRVLDTALSGKPLYHVLAGVDRAVVADLNRKVVALRDGANGVAVRSGVGPAPWPLRRLGRARRDRRHHAKQQQRHGRTRMDCHEMHRTISFK